MRVVCVGRSTGTDDVGFVGMALDEPRWVVPVVDPSPHPEPGPDDPLRTAGCLDVVELELDGAAETGDAERRRLVPGSSRRLGRLAASDAGQLHQTLLTLPVTGTGLSAVVVQDPTLLVQQVSPGAARRACLVWGEGDGAVTASVVDPHVVDRAERLPVGQHDLSTVGLPSGDVIAVVGLQRRPGRLLRRTIVLGLPHERS